MTDAKTTLDGQFASNDANINKTNANVAANSALIKANSDQNDADIKTINEDFAAFAAFDAEIVKNMY